MLSKEAMLAKEELMAILVELSRIAPNFRVGQLIALLTARAAEEIPERQPYDPRFVASIDDEELLPPAREFLENYRRRAKEMAEEKAAA